MSQSLTPAPKLPDRVRDRLRVRQYSWRTEQACVGWVERCLRFHKDRNGGNWKHPAELGKAEIEPFLTFLAVNRKVSPG